MICLFAIFHDYYCLILVFGLIYMAVMGMLLFLTMQLVILLNNLEEMVNFSLCALYRKVLKPYMGRVVAATWLEGT